MECGLPVAILEVEQGSVSVEPECVDIYTQCLVNESKLSTIYFKQERIACGDP
jgi:hypothetical protein